MLTAVENGMVGADLDRVIVDEKLINTWPSDGNERSWLNGVRDDFEGCRGYGACKHALENAKMLDI